MQISTNPNPSSLRKRSRIANAVLMRSAGLMLPDLKTVLEPRGHSYGGKKKRTDLIPFRTTNQDGLYTLKVKHKIVKLKGNRKSRILVMIMALKNQY